MNLHQSFLAQNIDLKSIGEDAEVSLSKPAQINANNLHQLASLSELEGDRFAVIGIGGGSDGVQAAQVAKLLEMNHKSVPLVISVRTAKPTSQGADGKVSAQRTIQDHGGEIAPGVFKVTPQSTGSGRFLENLPAELFPTYLVIDEENNTLTQRLEAAITHAGGAKNIIAVDTGGDALHSSAAGDTAKATPDQDLRVLKALASLHGVKILTAEIAVGVDSPTNAEEVLKSGHARYYDPKPNETQAILENYRRWQMDGSNDSRFGKTALAWQAALNGQEGLHALPLPNKVVADSRNPWNPFVKVAPSMRGVFFMELPTHLKAINCGDVLDKMNGVKKSGSP